MLIARAALLAAVAFAQDARVQQYLGLAQATLADPVTPEEIARALSSPSGVEDVARLFEDSLAASLAFGGENVAPEIGGEATLDGGALRFAAYPDPRHAVVRSMVQRQDDPAALLARLEETAEGRHVLQATGGLHALLFQMATQPVTDRQRRALVQVLSSAVATHFRTWTATPETQRAGIERHDWRGRYVGFWHLHPPRHTPGGHGAGLEPSYEDLSIAAEKGQMLTLVFQPDGFDAYDLSAVGAQGAPDLSKARVTRHRSPAWESRFRPRP
jgi:hypothetical protein